MTQTLDLSGLQNVVPFCKEKLAALNIFSCEQVPSFGGNSVVVNELMVQVGISAKHVHLTEKAFRMMYGNADFEKGMIPLNIPRQFASQYRVAIMGIGRKKGQFEIFRVLGPFRNDCQIEGAKTDWMGLGRKESDIKEKQSGQLQNTFGVEMYPVKKEGDIWVPDVNIKKSAFLDRGGMVAKRHIHVGIDLAEYLGLKDKDIVSVEVGDENEGLIFKGVIVRVDKDSPFIIHLDTDEANAANFGIDGSLVQENFGYSAKIIFPGGKKILITGLPNDMTCQKLVEMPYETLPTAA